MKNRVISICVLASITLLNCTTSKMYLQSARYTDDATYGYSILNPIILKCSKSFGNEKIIEEYISRLSPKQGGSFVIRERQTNTIQQSNAKQADNEIKNTKSSMSLDSLKCYEIISEDGKEIYTLYFKLAKNKQKLYVPFGMMVGYLSN